MKRYTAIETIIKSIHEKGALKDNTILVASNGMISRELYDIYDSNLNIYMLGSMGLAQSIALGIAMHTKKYVVAFIGDGNLLMNMGSLATINGLVSSGCKLNNLCIVVLDNGCYDSTGGQKTCSPELELERMAALLSFDVIVPMNQERLFECIGLIMQDQYTESNRPLLVHVEVEPGNENEVPRVPIDPVQMSIRIKDAI